MNCNTPATIVITNPCGELPLLLANVPATAGGNVAFRTGGNLLLSIVPFGNFTTYDVSGGGLIPASTIAGPGSFMAAAYSPLADEWVIFGLKTAGVQAVFQSYSMTLVLMAETGLTGVFNSELAKTVHASPTTGMAYACSTSKAASYDSVAHTLGGVYDFNVSGYAGRGSFAMKPSTDVDGGVPDILFFPLFTFSNPKVSRVSVVNGSSMTEIASIPLASFSASLNCNAHAALYAPDGDTVFVFGNDSGGDGGDVIWVIEATSYVVMTKLRLGSNLMTALPVGTPATTYDTTTRQGICTYRTNAEVVNGLFVVCADSNSFVGYIDALPNRLIGITYDDTNEIIFVSANAKFLKYGQAP